MTEPPRHPDIPYNVKEAALSLFSRTHIRNGSYILFNIHSSVVEVFVSSAFNFPLCPVGITLAQLIDRLMSLWHRFILTMVKRTLSILSNSIC